MSDIVEKLLIVQEHDCRIRDFEKELKDIPARKEEELKRLEAHKVALAEAEEQLKQKHADVKKLELESEAKNERIVKLRQQQLELKTNKEFKAMETEIKGVEKENSSIEEQQLEMMDVVEKAKADVDSRKNDLASEEAEVQSDINVLDKRVSEVEVELNKLRELREFSIKGIDQDWMKRYERVFERKDKALVPLENGICGGCHMKLPRYIAHDAKKQNGVMVQCELCGRLLY
ncbi:zinc ribbon domain-containing protein [Verrucomicrobiota bacterium]